MFKLCIPPNPIALHSKVQVNYLFNDNLIKLSRVEYK